VSDEKTLFATHTHSNLIELTMTGESTLSMVSPTSHHCYGISYGNSLLNLCIPFRPSRNPGCLYTDILGSCDTSKKSGLCTKNQQHNSVRMACQMYDLRPFSI